MDLLRRSLSLLQDSQALEFRAEEFKAACISWLRAQNEHIPMQGGNWTERKRSALLVQIQAISALSAVEIIKWFRVHPGKSLVLNRIILELAHLHT
jgi:hypothetical protein